MEKQFFDQVFYGGQCVVPNPATGKLEKQVLNIGISNDRIAAVTSNQIVGSEMIDCRHLNVLPGVIDSQVHFRDPGLSHKEDFESGTRSAALGGVTCVFDMPNTKPSTTTKELFQEKMSIVQGKAWVDFGCFIGASPENIGSLSELEILEGCPGIKVFLGSSTGNLLVEKEEDLEKLLKDGQRRVIVHSEDEARLRERKTLAVQGAHPRFHPIWRDEVSALISTERLLRIAKKVQRKVHVLHVTTGQEMELLAKHKSFASVEVLPQHLTLSAPECYEMLGTKAQMNPPIREKKHQEALWKAVQNGVVDVLGSDHAPHTLEEKAKTYPESPSGMTGVQTLVSIMLDHVNEGRLSLERFVELVCENPRWVFGCQDIGRIEVGLRANLTIVDLNLERRIENSWIQSRCGWTPFDGKKVKGWPLMTVVGGKIIARDGQLSDKGGHAVRFK